MVTIAKIGAPARPSRKPLVMVLAVMALAGFYAIYKMITPEMYQSLDPARPFGYLFVPKTSEYGRAHYVEAVFWSHRGQLREVRLRYDTNLRGNFASTSLMQRVKDSNLFSDVLPRLEKGKRYFYYFEVTDTAGNTLRLKVQKNWLERLATGPGENYFYVTFVGRVPKWLLLTHIVLIGAAIFFFVHALYFGLNQLVNGTGFPKAYYSVFWGWVTFAFAVLVLGYFVAYYGFGVGWGGFPIGWDITDNKSLLTALYWGVLLGLKPDYFLRRNPPAPAGRPDRRRDKLSDRGFIWAAIVGMVLTAAAYMIPHSIFFQR